MRMNNYNILQTQYFEHNENKSAALKHIDIEKTYSISKGTSNKSMQSGAATVNFANGLGD